jgi:UTP-glucose-1-phosphate uridylyltransferase
MKPTLLIIAAGMGSRYGGLKQIDPVGPNGEIIIDYSMHDAVAAGFEKIVFVIRRHFEDAFKEKIGSKLDGIVETAYAFQELDECLDDFPLPPQREKPWGTGHAILCAKDVIDSPFAVINADDYYGPSAFKAIKDYLVNGITPQNYTMVGYILRNTLSEYGKVARGICTCDQNNTLLDVVERTNITSNGDGSATFTDQQGDTLQLTGDEIVSMNLWGFDPTIFNHLQTQFKTFLAQQAQELKSEFYIPFAVDELIKSNQISVKVLETTENWFGVTYREDKEIAQKAVAKLIENKTYPAKLWS